MNSSKYTYLLLIGFAFSIGYLLNSNIIAQVSTLNGTIPIPQPPNPIPIPVPPVIVEPDVGSNVASILALITAVATAIGLIAGIIPRVIDIKRNVLGIKNEQDDLIIRTSQSVGETDDWVLENMDRIRLIGTGVLHMSPALNKLVTKQKEGIELTTEEVNQLNEGLRMIEQATPAKQEIKVIDEELKANSRDPKKIG